MRGVESEGRGGKRVKIAEDDGREREREIQVQFFRKWKNQINLLN